MEDKVIDIIIGKGPSARTLRLELEDITVIGATTRIGDIGAPLRSRFGASYRLDFLFCKDLEKIILQKARIFNVKIEDDRSAYEIARRSRGTARIAIQLLKRVRDYSEVKEKNKISVELAEKGFRYV